MCDTFVALPNHTTSGNLIFGKNSDREPNEAQAIIRLPAKSCEATSLQCTYIKIPQVKYTNEVILSKPFQMWGAEMGVNEHGVVIGNEAVFTKIKFPQKDTGLTGMDLVRIALERCENAVEARETITTLVEEYGQDACGGYENKGFYYHNSFIIADKETAWILETAGRHWAAKRVSGFGSISNGLTITSDYDVLSKNAISFAQKRGWHKKETEFSFRKSYSDWLYTKVSNCKTRQGKSEQMGKAKQGRFTVSSAIDILSQHHQETTTFVPASCTSAAICMHATNLVNPSQTTGSMIVEVREDKRATVWLTGTSNPCLSIYKPFFFGDALLSQEQWRQPTATPNDSLWWQAEQLNRMICKDYTKGLAIIQQEKVAFQQALLDKEQELFRINPLPTVLFDFSEQSLSHYQKLLSKWQSEVAVLNLKERSLNPFYRSFINKRDKML